VAALDGANRLPANLTRALVAGLILNLDGRRRNLTVAKWRGTQRRSWASSRARGWRGSADGRDLNPVCWRHRAWRRPGGCALPPTSLGRNEQHEHCAIESLTPARERVTVQSRDSLLHAGRTGGRNEAVSLQRLRVAPNGGEFSGNTTTAAGRLAGTTSMAGVASRMPVRSA